MELVDFLRARLDEDYEAARLVLGTNIMAGLKRGKPAPHWERQPDGSICDNGGEGTIRVKFTWRREADHIVRHDPARVLAEVEADRLLIAQYEYLKYDVMPDDMSGVFVLEKLLRAKAAVHASHSDYRDKWRP